MGYDLRQLPAVAVDLFVHALGMVAQHQPAAYRQTEHEATQQRQYYTLAYTKPEARRPYGRIFQPPLPHRIKAILGAAVLGP